MAVATPQTKMRPGYTLTDVGVLPNDWKVEHLRDECELITKGTTPTSFGRAFTSSGINFLKVETIDENGRIIRNKVAFIDEETNNLLRRSQLREKDILIS